MTLRDMPPSLRVYLKAEALKLGIEPEALLKEILAGGNPLPQHISELIREVYRQKRNEYIANTWLICLETRTPTKCPRPTHYIQQSSCSSFRQLHR